MKALVDQNLDEDLTDRLIAAGHDATHTKRLGMQRTLDEDVFEWCRQNDAILVTEDKKLTKYLAAQRATSPTVVILRGYLLDLDQQAIDLIANLPAVEVTITAEGHAVYSMAPNKPTRAQLLPLISEI